MSKFTNANNVYLLRELFWETANDRSNAVYTLKNQEHEGLPSLYQCYMSCIDPTEYEFATKYLGGWEHWQQLSACSWFRDYVKKWRDEFEVKTRSNALSKIILKAEGDSREAFAAAKYVADGYGIKTKRGRPSKEEIAKTAKEIASNKSRLDADLLRITGGD